MKKWWIVIIGLLVLFSLWLFCIFVSHRWRDLSSYPHAENHHLTILTYNTHRMGNFKKIRENEVVKLLQSISADILCLQEVEVYKDETYLTLPELREAFADYPYTYYDFKIYNTKRQYGNVVFSKFPLINKHTIRYSSKGNITSCCDVVAFGDTMRLMVNHLESNRIDLENDDEKVSKFGSAGRIRARQAWTVRKAMNQSPYPLLVVGDFNALPISFTYQCLKHNMRDCFLETSRWELGCTYMHKRIGVRIDYILCSKDMIPYDFQIIQSDASDHYPIVASIEWVPGSDNP